MEQIFDEDSSPINTEKMELLSDCGSEFIVYRYLNSVIKIYKKNYQLSHLTLEELETLKSILTQRILLPTSTLWNSNHELIGYKMPFISSEKNRNSDTICNFFEELEVLRQDLELLCKHLIILRDISLSNTIYNGHIYLIDPGNYLINELDKIIFDTNITNLSIAERFTKIVEEGEYYKVKNLTDSLTLEEKQDILRNWNYNKINILIDMLLFSKRNNIDAFKYRQIVQFIMKKRIENGFIYSLDVLKMFFNPNLSISNAIDDFIVKYIKENAKERELFLSLYKK